MYLKFYAGDSYKFALFDYDTKCLSDLKRYVVSFDGTNNLTPDFSDFEEPIKTLIYELKESYFTKCLQKIMNHICSDEDLENEANDHSLIDCIFYHTKWLAVEFYLTGATNNDVKNIPRNICNNGVDNHNQTRHLVNSCSNLGEYFRNRTLLEQLQEVELIYELFKSNQVATFFIEPHYNVSDKVDFNLFGVHITSETPKQINPEKFTIPHRRKKESKKIIGNTTLYAMLNVDSNHSDTIQFARERVLSALRVFSDFSNNDYILRFEYKLSNNESRIPLQESVGFDNEGFQSRIYDYYKKGRRIINSDIDDFLIKNDKIFISGIHNSQRSQILSNLWFYLESYYDSPKTTISKTSELLATRMKNEFDVALYEFLSRKYFDFIIGFHDDVNKSDMSAFFTNDYSEVEEKLRFFKKRFKHPLITKKLIKFDTVKCKEKEKFKDFISDYLGQVYINRNLHVHSLNENYFFTGGNLELLVRLANFFRQYLIGLTTESIETKQ